MKQNSLSSSKIYLPPQKSAGSYFDLWRQYRRQAILFGGILFVLSCAVTFKWLSIYKADALLVMDKKGSQNEWELLVDDVKSADYESQIRSRVVLEPVLKKFHLIDLPSSQRSSSFLRKMWANVYEFVAGSQSEDQKLAAAIDDFQEKISIQRPRQSNILDITVKDKDPNRAAAYANAIAQSFVTYKRDEAIDRTKQFIQGIEQELETVQASVNTAIRERNEFILENGWDDYFTELKHSGAKVANLKDSIRSLEVYQASVISDNRKSGKELSKPPVMPGQTGRELSLIDVARQYVEADKQYSSVSGVYREELPGVLQARLEKEMIESVLKDKLRNPEDRNLLLQKQLNVEQQALHGLLQAQPKVQKISTVIDYSNQRLLELLDQKAKANFLLTQWQQQPADAFGELRILDHALPPPWRSRKIVFFISLMTAAILCAVGMILLPLFFSLWETEFSKLLGRPENEEPLVVRSREPAGEPPYREEALKYSTVHEDR